MQNEKNPLENIIPFLIGRCQAENDLSFESLHRASLTTSDPNAQYSTLKPSSSG